MLKKNLPFYSKMFIKVLGNLTEIEKGILIARFVENESLVQVGNRYGLTNQSIKNIEDKVLLKIEREFDLI